MSIISSTCFSARSLFAEIHVGFVYELACRSSTVPVFFLHPHFSLAIINREIWKVFGKVYFVERKYSVIRRTPSFEQISIEQVYFLVKNGAPYK